MGKGRGTGNESHNYYRGELGPGRSADLVHRDERAVAVASGPLPVPADE